MGIQPRGSCRSQSRAPNLNHCPVDFPVREAVCPLGCSGSSWVGILLAAGVSAGHSRLSLAVSESCQGDDKALPEAQASVTTERVNVGRTEGEVRVPKSTPEGRYSDGGRSKMSSKSVPVGRVREWPPHEGAEFGCGMGRREIFLRTVVTFPDSCITADYQSFLPLCPGGFVRFLRLFVCLFFD